mmetsp:Transcript_13520/g.13254  ORF Transcript_13520/g.13254 Transcript_13520/m.13254 type:complete len:158 (+) Transcript_13520:1013-1486(+)
MRTSFCESEQEYAANGKIRATTYKYGQDGEKKEENKPSLNATFLSEERKPCKYFSTEFLQHRYINERVEMELVDFQKQIEKKYAKGEILGYQFPRMEKERKHLVILDESIKQEISLGEEFLSRYGKTQASDKNKNVYKTTEKTKSKNKRHIDTSIEF